MPRRLLTLLAAILFFLAPGMPCAFGQDNPPAQYKVLEELNVRVAMRDGIRLSTISTGRIHPANSPPC